MNWFAIYTKPKSEDGVVKLLNNAGIETLNPKIMVTKYMRRTYSEVVEHLFPCYIFALFDEVRHSHMIRYTRGVKYIVGKERPMEVPSEVIGALRNRMQGVIVMPVPERIDRGEKVLIKEGPFKDFHGVFERQIPGRNRAMILLEALHCRFEVENRSICKASSPLH
jgi:transcriptional antiterminator RfaH